MELDELKKVEFPIGGLSRNGDSDSMLLLFQFESAESVLSWKLFASDSCHYICQRNKA